LALSLADNFNRWLKTKEKKMDNKISNDKIQAERELFCSEEEALKDLVA